MALEITPERVQAAAARLADGGWFFNERQLYYAVCRDIEVPPSRVAPAELSLGAILILIGTITGNRVALAALGGLGVLLLLLGVVSHVTERRPLPEGRVLAVSFDAFREERIVGHAYHGLVERGTRAPDVIVDGSVVLVCDRPDTAAMLRANAAHIAAGVHVVETGSMDSLSAGTRVVAVHDASPTGCSVAADARDRALSVVDAGLNPRDVVGNRVQLLEGAPARLPRDLRSSLEPAEMAWLTGGRRVELATLSPEEVVVRVRAALQGDATPRH